MSNLSDSNLHPRCIKVAVVGSGLAGLTAAYLLSIVPQRGDIRHNGGPVEYEVHVFEKVSAPPHHLLAKFAYSSCQADTLGMDSHSVSFKLPGEKGEWRVDVPMRSFQGGKYSLRSFELCRLMIAQRLLPSAHRALLSPRRVISAFEFFIFVFQFGSLSLPRCGSKSL
jgi:hypothetical protein